MKLLRALIARFRNMRRSVGHERNSQTPPPTGDRRSINLTREQLHELMKAALEDSPRAREIVRQAFLPAFPIQGGTATQDYIVKYADGSGNLTNSIMFESGTKIGINTASPVFNLDLNGNVFAIGPKTATPGTGGSMRFRDDSGNTEAGKPNYRWLFGIPGTSGSQDFFMYNGQNGHAPLYIENAAPSNMLHLTGDGSVVLGGTTAKQSTDHGGRELLSFQHTAANHVAFACFVGSESNFQFGASLHGFMEWGPGTGDQDVALFRAGVGAGLSIQSFNNTPSDHAFSVQRPTSGPDGADLFRVSTGTGRITQAAGEVALKAHGDDSSWSKSDAFVTTAALQTTNTSAAQTLATLSTESSRAYQILVRVVARQSAGTPLKQALFFRTALASNEGGTLSLSQTNVVGALGGTDWTCSFAISGTNILVQVQTPTQNNITVNWVATIEYQSVGTNL